MTRRHFRDLVCPIMSGQIAITSNGARVVQVTKCQGPDCARWQPFGTDQGSCAIHDGTPILDATPVGPTYDDSYRMPSPPKSPTDATDG